MKYYVGTLGQDLITQRLSEKHWKFIDSNQGVKWFPHTKDMGKEINRWVNSQNFSDNAIFSSDYQKFSIGSSTLKIEGKGMPPREPPANVYGSLDPRRRRPQQRYERELNSSGNQDPYKCIFPIIDTAINNAKLLKKLLA